MKSNQYRAILNRLGLNQGSTAEFFKVSLRTSHNWANDSTPIPEAVAKLLRLMVRLGLKPADVK